MQRCIVTSGILLLHYYDQSQIWSIRVGIVFTFVYQTVPFPKSDTSEKT